MKLDTKIKITIYQYLFWIFIGLTITALIYFTCNNMINPSNWNKNIEWINYISLFLTLLITIITLKLSEFTLTKNSLIKSNTKKMILFGNLVQLTKDLDKEIEKQYFEQQEIITISNNIISILPKFNYKSKITKKDLKLIKDNINSENPDRNYFYKLKSISLEICKDFPSDFILKNIEGIND